MWIFFFLIFFYLNLWFQHNLLVGESQTQVPGTGRRERDGPEEGQSFALLLPAEHLGGTRAVVGWEQGLDLGSSPAKPGNFFAFGKLTRVCPC